MVCRLFEESIIRNILRQSLSAGDYFRVCEKLENCPRVDAIPEAYIIEFAKKRDPVYQSNMNTLISCYHHAQPKGDEHEENFGL